VLGTWRGDVAGELDRRGVVRRSRLRQVGVDADAVPGDAVSHGDWLVSRAVLDRWQERLRVVVAAAPDGVAPEAAARSLDLPDPELLSLAVSDPVTTRQGRLVVDRGLPPSLVTALTELADDLASRPFVAPDAERLRQLGLEPRTLGRLARDGHLLTVGDGVYLLPGADSAAYDELSTLEQPFTTSQARQRLGTTRRVVLPLLTYLDRTGRTVRLPDDTRRVVPGQTAR
jgi:selenocysteine-specific elongation factor